MPLFVLGLSSLAPAQTPAPIATDRPGYSDGSNLVAPGMIQFEGGFFRTQSSSGVTTSLGDGLLRFGLNQKLELRLIGISYGSATGVQQWLEPSIGFKARLLQNSHAEITFVGQSTVPIGDGVLRSNAWNPTLKIAATTPTGRDTLGGNVVFARLGSGASRFDQYALSLFVTRPLTDRTALTGEIWGVDRVEPGGPGAGFASLAVTHLLSPNQQLDLRIGTGFNQQRDGWFLQGGFSVRF